MTDYIISEEELRQIYWKKKEPFPRILIDFLKSKQPITKVAEGYLYMVGDGHEWTGYSFDDKPSPYADKNNNILEKDHYHDSDFEQYFYNHLKDLVLKDYRGKHIEIYIKESK